MHVLEISYFDHPELDRHLQVWMHNLADLKIGGIAVLGPKLDGDAHLREIMALQPTASYTGLQELLSQMDADTLGNASDRWIGFAQLSNIQGNAKNHLFAQRFQSLAWVAVPLPSNRRLECVFLSQMPAFNKEQLGALSLSALATMPKIRNAITQAHNILSSKEIQCLQLAFGGQTSKEIAMSMRLTERTTNYHLTNAMLKLKVKNKMAAAQRACWLGLI